MKKYLFSLLALLTILSGCSPESSRDYSEVNPIVGDLSSRLGTGLLSPENQTEQQRVATHLAFAEHILRSRNVDHLSSQLQKRRARMLNLLEEYWQAGVFPGNYDHPGQRRPCFIDQKGNICAVGYLVEQTAGYEAASDINRLYQYADISEMDHGSLDSWIAESGLSRDEVALIQPTYGNINEPIRASHAAASAFTAGIGTGCSIISLANMKTPGSDSYRTGKALPAVGLGFGTLQTLLGLAPMITDWRYQNAREQNLGMVNIGVGLTNMMVNGYALLRKRPARAKSPQVNLFNAPLDNQRMAWGMSLTKRF